MSALPARAVSLDVDGTLYRVRKLRVAWRLRWERGLLVAMMAAREKVRHEPPLADGEALLRRQAELVAPSFDLPVEEAVDRLRALRAGLADALTRGVRPYGGVRSALEAAHARGLALAVLSDFDPLPKLRHLGLADLPWAACLGAEDSGALKPHARVYERLVDALGLPPASIVHVGDREDLDVAGALGVGMRAWRFDPKRGGGPSAAEHGFSRWGVATFEPLWAPPVA